MPFLGCFTGRDDGLKAKGASASGGTCPVLADGMLPNIKAEELKPNGVVMVVQGVGDPGFAWL
jgi:hypothetical protein